MIDELMPAIRADGKRVKTMTVKVRYPGIENSTAGRSLTEAIRSADEDILLHSKSRGEGLPMGTTSAATTVKPVFLPTRITTSIWSGYPSMPARPGVAFMPMC